ncbi:MAG: eukaryotic-like serine/threonine-protein kinase [Blastocatellia bacterium]|nr:eukaryotic-like serine/threonine-protein kinase [Blastocatellia bacterium]
MGEVFLAEDTKLGRKVALKLLAEELTQNRDRLSRFDQEAYAASALNHPNILTIYEMGDDEGRHFIATEFIEGITLRKRLGGAPMDLGEVLNVAIQVAGALEEAHAARIVHRDIKPENIMIRRNGHVKVLDFGLAKLTEEPDTDEPDTEAITRALVQTDAGVVMGTSQYMSPEQARGKPVDARTDIWSLGVVLYEMASGRAPFTGETKTDVILAIARNDPAPLARFAPNAPAEFEWIMLKALRKNVDERYQTVKELESDLKTLKQRLEFQTELERSVGPERLTGALSVAGIPYADTEIPGPLAPLHTTRPYAIRDSGSASRTVSTRASSAEYLVGEIQRHKIGTLIAGLVVLLAASALVYFFYFRERVRLTDKDKILLADFVNSTGDPVFDGTLKQALAVQLGQSPYLDIFSEDRVREMLIFMEKPPDERITREVAREICERQGIKAMLLGTISSIGSHYAISLEAVNAHTGDSITSEQVEADGKEQVLKALGQASSKLREKLGESLSSVQKFDAPIEQATTSSLEALQAYSRGFEKHSNGKYNDAISFYKDAIARDPYFAIAWSRLASCYNNTRQNELAREAFDKAYVLRDRASEREKLNVSANYYGGVTGEWDKQIEQLEIWKRTYPRDWEPFNLLANRYTLVGPFEKAIENAQEAVRLNPADARPYANLAVAFMGLNKFDAAKDVLSRALSQKLETTNMHARLYHIAFLQGDAAAMKDQLDWAAAKPEEAQTWQAQTSEFSGQLLKANQFNERAVELARQAGVKEIQAHVLLQQAGRHAMFGNCAPVTEIVNSALALSRERANLVAAANALAACGQVAAAQANIEELSKRFDKDTLLGTISIPMARAHLELNRGNAAQVIQLLDAAKKYDVAGEFWPQYLRGQAYLKLGNGAQAATEFKTIIDHRGWYPVSALFPMAHLGIARAYALSNDSASARKYYQDFFTLWKDADPTIPILIEARAEYDKLK